MARSKELLAQVEKEFAESGRTASARWFSDLEAKATETIHSTFEALYKSAEWYEKKVQTQMQTTLEKGLDQAASNLRDKAGELSGLFATELDHYSRTYVEHAQTQMQDNAREIAERTGAQMTEAGETAAAGFTARTHHLASEQFDLYASKTSSAFEQSSARIESHAIGVRSKLEDDARSLAEEYRNTISQHTQQTLDQGKDDLGTQVDLAKDALRTEAQSLDLQFRASLRSYGSQAIEDHKQRLENASNSWLLTTVTKLHQQSEGLIEQLAATTEEHLKKVCDSVFADVGETLRQRLAGLSGPVSIDAPATPPSAGPAVGPFENRK